MVLGHIAHKLRLRKTAALLSRLLLAAQLVAAAACAQQQVGYGVILWAEANGLYQTATVVHVMAELDGGAAYRVKQAEAQASHTIPAWRVRLLPTIEQADAFASNYVPYTATYACVEKNGLPVRRKPSIDAEATILVSLADGQLLKILGRDEYKDISFDFDDYWYHVLTEQGVEGYCYGHYLMVFATEGDPHQEIARLKGNDTQLNSLLNTDWRPEYFQEMIDNGRIDLARFRAEVGLFPDPTTQSFTLTTSGHSAKYVYSSVERIGESLYVFAEAGLRITVQSSHRIVASYLLGQGTATTVYVRLRQNLADIIASEEQRRAALYESFRAQGDILKSERYGEIAFAESPSESRSYIWSGTERLPSGLLPGQTIGKGSIEFSLFLGDNLKPDYEGVISFRFAEYTDRLPVSFLYRYSANGIQLVFVRQGQIENGVVESEAPSPFVLFFRPMSIPVDDETAEIDQTATTTSQNGD